MAVLNKADCKGKLVLESSEDDFTKTNAEVMDYPLAVANHSVTTAAKLTLAAGTRICICGAVEGAVYAISGMPDTPDIAADEGFYIGPNVSGFPIPIGKHTDGTLHTRLLVIAAA